MFPDDVFRQIEAQRDDGRGMIRAHDGFSFGRRSIKRRSNSSSRSLADIIYTALSEAAMLIVHDEDEVGVRGAGQKCGGKII
jgi:hypothetical protein